MLAQDRVVIGNVRTDQKNDIGLLQVFVGSGRPVAAERALVTRDGAGHAQGCVAVVILGAET